MRCGLTEEGYFRYLFHEEFILLFWYFLPLDLLDTDEFSVFFKHEDAFWQLFIAVTWYYL